MNELIVYELPGRWGLPSVSPFCLKLDAFLRINGIPFQSVTAATPFGGPKSKAPWIELNGKKIGDSSLIIEYLKSVYSTPSENSMTPLESALTVLLERLIEENLYWCLVFDRWRRPENWNVLKDSILGDIPWLIRQILAPFARRSVTAQLKGHGMGLHSPEEIEAIAQRDLTAISECLGDAPFFCGTSPRLADATVYSLLANIWWVEFQSPMKAMIESSGNLVPFLERFRTQVYGDLP